MGNMVNVTPWPLYSREKAPVTIILSVTNINLYAFLDLIFYQNKQVMYTELYILLHTTQLLFLF